MTIVPGGRRPPVFTRYFEFFRVGGYDLLDAAYRIRYQVYCEERGFLDPRRYPGQLETDEYDPASVHFVGRHRFRCLAAGTVRLVLASDLGFPLQHHCRLDREFAFLTHPGHPDLRHYAEISRLAVSKIFRQRADDTLYGGPPRPPPEPAAFMIPGGHPPGAGPEIVAGLFKTLYHETRRLGLTHLIVAMERSLFLLLKRMGYHFHAIGPVVDYYGPVAPYVARIRDIERYLYSRRRSVYDYWMADLEPEYLPALPEPEPPRRRTRAGA